MPRRLFRRPTLAHVGFVISRKDGKENVAVRVKTEDLISARASLRLETRDTWIVQGLPQSITKEELQEVLDNAGWTAEPSEHGKRSRGNTSSWLVYASAPHTVMSWPIRSQGRRYLG